MLKDRNLEKELKIDAKYTFHWTGFKYDSKIKSSFDLHVCKIFLEDFINLVRNRHLKKMKFPMEINMLFLIPPY